MMSTEATSRTGCRGFELSLLTGCTQKPSRRGTIGKPCQVYDAADEKLRRNPRCHSHGSPWAKRRHFGLPPAGWRLSKNLGGRTRWAAAEPGQQRTLMLLWLPAKGSSSAWALFP